MPMKSNFKNKKLIVFDLDGTLTESKSDVDKEMILLLGKLLRVKKVAVIGGGRFLQFKKQFLVKLDYPPELLKNLFLFPTTSTSFYRYKNGWKKVYEEKLRETEKKKIMSALKNALKLAEYKRPKKTYGKVIEDRGSQITFSALGQKAPLPAKKKWNKESDIRPVIIKGLRKRLTGFEIHSGGLTSVDVTKKGIDKAYGLHQIKKHLGVPIKDMLFVGDALYLGGNDRAVLKTGVNVVSVAGPKETKKIIRSLIA